MVFEPQKDVKSPQR